MGNQRNLAVVALLLTAVVGRSDDMVIPLRSQSQPFKSRDDWQVVSAERKVEPKDCALVLCDIWDKHWCPSATKRCDVIAKQVAEVVENCRAKGMFVIHCPSDTMAFYAESAARKRMTSFPKPTDPKLLREIKEPKLPIDDSDGGCDDVPQPKSYRAWSRQHAAIKVDEEKDGVTDSGAEVWSAIKAKKIKTVFVMGVHTNMCILNRGFAIRSLTRQGVDCILVRDLTDAMYNPAREPKVSHDEGTALVIQHIERFWCPTCESTALRKK